jgi:hypothetical protein
MDLPRPAPESIRKATASEPGQKTTSAPVSPDSALQESTRKSKRSIRGVTQTTNGGEEAPKAKKITSKQNSRVEPSGTEETPWRREDTFWGREERSWKSEEASRGSGETSGKREREETSRGRKGESRRTGVTESRGYQLPSGRRIIVFRQSNGEVGIAPDTGGSSAYFFGR